MSTNEELINRVKYSLFRVGVFSVLTFIYSIGAYTSVNKIMSYTSEKKEILDIKEEFLNEEEKKLEKTY